MAECKNIRAVRRKVCAGDLDRTITLLTRSIATPTDAVDFTEDFSPVIIAGSPLPSDGMIMALIKTVTGEEVFDSHGTGTAVTHHIYVPFVPEVTSENWILLDDGTRLKLVAGGVEDLDERHEFLLLRATNVGTETQSNNAI